MKKALFLSVVVAVLVLFRVFPTNAWKIEGVPSDWAPKIAVDSSGHVHISSVAWTQTPSWAPMLKYTTNVSGSWVSRIVDDDIALDAYERGSQSIAVNSSGKVHISYCNDKGFKYATNTSGSWEVETVVSGGNFQYVAASSIAVNSSGNAHIIYSDTNGCRYVTNASGSWEVEMPPFGGYRVSIAVDSSNKVHISGCSPSGCSPVFYATKENGSWISEPVDDGCCQCEALFTSIAVDSSGKPHISYTAVSEKGCSEGEVSKYATRDNGSWSITELDTGEYYSAGNAIAVDPWDKMHIIYYHQPSKELRYATNAYGAWRSVTVESVGGNEGRWEPSIAIDPSGMVHIVYESGWPLVTKYASQAPIPDISVSPPSHDFELVNLGSSSTHSITVSNIGYGDLIIDSVDIAGKNASDFSQTNDCSTIAHDDSCTITVAFTPSSLGKKNAVLTISSNAHDEPVVHIELVGIGFISNTWAKTYGGIWPYSTSSIRPTSDGGYIMAGGTGTDAWILKLDFNGDIEWQKIYDGGDIVRIEQTADGNYIAAGSRAMGGTCTDLWVLKLMANGDIDWQKTYGIELWHSARAIQQTIDGGYIVAGYVYYGFGEPDFWVLKLDESGNIEWQKRCGIQHKGSESAYSVQQTSDGGYIVAGAGHHAPCSIRQTDDGYIVGGTSPILVLKLNAGGEREWQKEYSAPSLVPGDFCWVFKLNSDGGVSWQKSYDNGDWEWLRVVQQTSDGGYIVAGFTGSSRLGVWNDNRDIWILKLDENGNIQWQKAYGGEYDERAFSIEQTPDDGYVVAGFTNSFGVGEPGTENFNALVLKIDKNGNISGCPAGIIKPSNTTVADTGIKVEDWTIPCWDTDISSLESDASAAETNITPDIVCVGSVDSDNDGVADTEEMGPDGTDINYDGNNDGIPDSRQGNVASLHTVTGDYVTLSSPDGTSLTNVQAVDNPSPADAPGGVDFPYGFFEFTINGVAVGGVATGTLILPDGASPATYWKYGPTPDDATEHWYEFMYDGSTGTVIGGNVITLHFVDGQRGDDDLQANGVIVEPGSPGVSTAIAIPGDLDGDGDVDRDDLNIILSHRNQPASVCPDCDLDGDGMITALDARKLVLLCTRPRCACEEPPG